MKNALRRVKGGKSVLGGFFKLSPFLVGTIQGKSRKRSELKGGSLGEITAATRRSQKGRLRDTLKKGFEEGGGVGKDGSQ